MASLPGAVMKKSSGYGSALSLARAISVSARAGDSGSLGCGSGQPYSQRALGQFGLQPVVGGSHVAAAHIFATAQQALRRRRVFKDSASRKARFMASAKRCQRCSRGSVSASKPRRRHRRFQTARCARRGGHSAARRSPPGWRRCRWGFTTGARAAACRRLTLAETKKSKGEQYGVGNSIVT